MFENATYLYWLIVICEVSFWIFLASGLAVRYLLRQNRLSKFLLFSLPAIDSLLIAFTAADLKAGAPPTFAHGLAAAYVGFTVAFGSIAVAWADQHFAHWVGEGQPPNSGQTGGWEAVVVDLSLWFRAVVAWIVALVLLTALMAYVDNPVVAQTLKLWYGVALGSVILWFIFGPAWSLVFFRRKNGNA